MRESLIWHPVSIREASKEEFREQVAQNLPEPGVVRVGKWPEPDMVYLVTLTNGEVDVDEFDIDGGNDWFYYDSGCVIAWMQFPLFSPEDRSNTFWHLCEECCPTENRDFLVYDIDGKYAVLPFDVQKKAFMAAPCAPLETTVAFADLPEPYKTEVN